MNETSFNVEAGDMGLAVAFVLMVGGIIKNFTPINNKWIPLITWALGGLLYQWLSDGWSDPRQWMMALLSVAGATGLHSATQSTLSSSGETPKPQIPTIPLLLIGALAFGFTAPMLTGCSTPQQRIAFNSLATVQTVTVAAYDGYAAGVVRGTIPADDLSKVSRRFDQFQAAFTVALDAVQYNTNALAPESLQMLSTDLLNLITQLSTKD